MLRRTFLAGLLMPNLVDAWFADRSPGGGKVVFANPGTASTAATVGGLVGAGVSSLPASSFPALPEPGTPIPPAGSSPTSGPGSRASFFAVFRNSTGFDGNTWLSVPNGTAGTRWAFSCWLNFGVNNVIGFTPNPLTQFGTIIIAAAAASNTFVGGGGLQLNPSKASTDSGPQLEGLASSAWGGVAYPGDGTMGAGWFHLMASAAAYEGGISNLLRTATERFQCYINDTKIFDATLTGATSNATLFGYDFSGSAGAGSLSIGVSGAPAGENLYAGVAELWEAPGHFVDWSVQANRYKFHTVDDNWGAANAVYAPVDIGPTGARPFGFKPRLYLSGGPSQFPINRATGISLTVNGDALVAIDDPPSL